eukprot:353123-Chlamydomonas_euryale.AAC.5
MALPLAPGAEGGIEPEHRLGVLPLLIRVLLPKLRKRSGRLAGKGSLGSARAAVLNYMAAMHASEVCKCGRLGHSADIVGRCGSACSGVRTVHAWWWCVGGGREGGTVAAVGETG